MLFKSVPSNNGKQTPAVLFTLFALLFCLHSECLLACDRIYRYTAENGTLLSEEKLAYFLGPTRCIWEIQVPKGYRIELTVRVFEIKTSCCSCIEDYVEFRDGLNSTSPFIGRYCANNKPFKVYSSENVLRVLYYSSARNHPANLTTVNKFRADYRTICGEFIRGSQGVIRSPPRQNLTSVDQCLFTIVVPYGWVKVTFTNFTVGNTAMCYKDFVTVKEMAFVELKSTTRRSLLCGELKPFYIFSKGHQLSLLYQKSRVSKSNFLAKFEGTNTSTAPCGGLFTNDIGYIYSYHYPKPYPRDTECVWKIEVPYGYIELKFLEFNFASETRCTNGQVDVYDGWSSNAVKIRTDCRQLHKQILLKSKSNRLLIKATSESNEAGTFVLSYKLVDQGLCAVDQFSCTTRECVNQRVVCDGFNDCLDGSDELNCPKKKNSKTMYVLWALIVFIASALTVILLWRTWRKAVHRTVHIQRVHRPDAEDYACEVPSQSGAPPTYSEALNHTPTSLPSYEEALLNENGGVILERENTVRFLAPSDSCTRHLLPRYDLQRTHGRPSSNTRQSQLAIV